MDPRPQEHQQQHSTVGRRVWIARAALAVWAPLLVLALATLMAGHWAPLPRPASDDAEMPSRVLALGAPDEGTEVVVVHVLDAECRCSLRIVDHLLEGDRPGGVTERVLLTGPDDDGLADQLADVGFDVHARTRDELDAEFGLLGAPMFLVVDAPAASLLYAGGYTPRQQSLDVRDQQLIAEARDTRAPLSSLPVFGCGVSPSLRAALDPLGIKY